ncbi:hypothetical protein HYPSUDRAFT_46464, partial [Hypholoma sublateritium FD-334 SS-4]
MVGGTKLEAAIYATNGPSWSCLVSNINAFFLAIVADGLLIWRCYNVWEKSLCSIIVPTVLYLVTIGACIASTITISIGNMSPEKHEKYLTVQIGIGIFSSFALTLATTLLILYRIYSFSRHSITPRKGTPYGGIMDYLIKSAAIYSVVSLVYGISWIVTLSPNRTPASEVSEKYLQKYMQIIFFITAGMVPTIMVAQIARLSSNEIHQSRAQLSTLRFQGDNTTI